MRKYVLAFDYSIDRDPTYTWGGGATGDLTLLSVTQVGADGSSTLPPLTFYYTGARLGSASNGIGGTVTYSYERVATTPIYSVCFAIFNDPDRCEEWGAGTTPTRFSTLLGHALTTPAPGTVPLYSVCFAIFNDPDRCEEWGAGTTPTRFSTLLGYIYVSKVDRYRVTGRSVSDGRGGTSATTFSYSHVGLSSDGKEFRGHASVRAMDPLGHYADTWFKQDDALKGRAYQVEARSSAGALFTQVVNTWSTTNPFPGVTFVALSRADTYTCDGDATCRQGAQTFQYDSLGNPTEVQHLGDVAVTGDERTDVTEYAPNTTAYIVGLPSHALTRDAAGATVAETWFYYDGATAHTTPPTTGNLTQRCHWLNGGVNPCVTMAYDAFGNVTATTDARGNTTRIAYDATFQTFPATVTTPPTPNVPGGLVTTSAYDARFGVVTSTTDPNNQTTTYAYDTLGRVTGTTNPLGHTLTTSYDAFGTVGSQRVTSRLPDASPDGLWSEEYFDGLGRTFQVRKEAAVSQVTVLETAFDSRGLVSQKSLPRFEGAAPLWTTFAYDPLGRPTTTTFPDSTMESTAYSDWTVTVTDRAGRTRSSVKDAYGRVRQITEPGGAMTTYAYDTMGRLNRVTDAATNVTTIAYDTLGRKTSMTEPNMGTWAYVYDANGNLTSQTDAKGQTLTFAYDALNRLTTKAYPGGATVSFTYDTGLNGKGRRTAMTDLAGSASYAYDVLGRQISVTRVTDGVSYTTQTAYTSLGQPASLTYPDGEVLTYTYDAGGRVFSVAGAQTYVSSMTYNASAQVTQVTFGNGVLTDYTYGATTLRLTSLVTSQGATSLQNLSYTYDNVGNIAAITDNRTPSNNQSFAYDSLDRLTSATGPYGTETYSYNTIGNLLSKAGVSYTYGATGQTCNRLMPHAVTSTSDGKTYTYDCNGNLLADGQRTLTWDADNKPVSITLTGVGTTTLAYSGDGARVKKVGTTRAIRYAGAFEDHLTELAQVKHIFAGPLRVATRVTSGGPNAGVYFIHGDHLGSLNVLTNSSGAEVQRLTYRPWGETQSNTGTVDFDQRRFTGQEQDPETGLYFYQARYYNPELGRFVSPDPIVPGAGDPQNLNRYSYANNNPVNFTDPTGHFSFKKFFKRIIPIIVGVVVAIVAPPLGAPTVGMLAGMSAGATGAIVNGGNVLQGALMGGVFGALGGALAPGLFGGLGGVSGAGFWANLGPTLGTAGILGAGFGGLQAAMGGTSILEGMAVGALTAAAVAAVVYGGIELYEQANRSPALASASNVSEASTANSNYIPDETAPGGFSDQPLNQPDTRLAARYVIGTDVVSDMDPLMIMPSPVTGPGLAAIRYGANPAYKALNTLSRSLWGKPIESFFRIERGFIHGMGRDTLHINIGGRGSGLPFNLHIHRGNMYRFWEWHK